MKRLMLLALFVVGCGATEESQTWTVELNGGVAPTCTGSMAVSVTPASLTTFSGQWSCVETADDCAAARMLRPGFECLNLHGQVSNGLIANTGTAIFESDALSARFLGVSVGQMIAGHSMIGDLSIPIVIARR